MYRYLKKFYTTIQSIIQVQLFVIIATGLPNNYMHKITSFDKMYFKAFLINVRAITFNQITQEINTKRIQIF